MSVDLQLKQRSTLRQFYTTGAAPCPYLAGHVERRIYTLLRRSPQERQVFDRLSEAGFRRSQNLMYRPACPDCSACVPVRIAVDRFAPSRTERRVLNRNSNLTVREVPAVPTGEHWELFRRYLAVRHKDGGMATMTRADFETMVGDWTVTTSLLEGRDEDGRLLAVSLTDKIASGYSGVYKFYDPDDPRRSLGTWIILQLVEKARREGLPFVYLGYWVGGSEKMDYKARFRPMERLTRDGWVDMPDTGLGPADTTD